MYAGSSWTKIANKFFTVFNQNMEIESIQPSSYALNKHQNQIVSFGKASDITIGYVLKNRAKYLPQSIKTRIKELVTSGFSNKRLNEVHEEVYKDLFAAKTLDEAAEKFPEFAGVKDVTELSKNRSKAIKFLMNIMPLEKFTLDYIKKLYRPTSQDKLVNEYGFTNRSLLAWLNKKLNIKKLSGSYIKLLKMCDEKENERIAELSRRAIYSDAKVQKYRLQKAAEAHRTPEYRAKKRQEMKDYYIRHPETAQKTGLISKMTWDRCPEIKKAFSDYTKSLDSYTKKIMSKKIEGRNLNEQEKRIASTYYSNFWNQYPQFKTIYRERRLEVIKELKNKD